MRGLAAMAERAVNKTRFLHTAAEHGISLDVVRPTYLDRRWIDLARIDP